MPLLAPLYWTLAVVFTLPPIVVALELLKAAYAIPLAALFIAWLCTFVFGFRGEREAAHPPGQPRTSGDHLRMGLTVVFGLIVCVAWIYFSGIGSFAVCRWDYVKHNFIFSELLQHQLPITIGDSNFILHYPFSYYILPVRLTQLLQAVALPVDLNWLLLISYSGVAFGAAWLMARDRAIPVLALLAVLVFSGGLDLLGMLALGVKVELYHIGNIPVPWNLEWWGLPYAPQSLMANLYWAPQHFFGALVGTALVMHVLRLKRPAAIVLADVAILVSAAAQWSPYVAVGLAALAAVQIAFVEKGALLRRALQEGAAVLRRSSFLAAVAFAVAMVAFDVAFFLAARPLTMPILLLSVGSFRVWLITLLANYAPFLIALAIVLGLLYLTRRGRGDVDTSSLWRLARAFIGFFVASALLLNVAHGNYNDWAMRSTLPLWIAMAVAGARLLSLPIGRWFRAAFIVVLVAASADSLAELEGSVLGTPNCAPYGAFGLDALGDLSVQDRGAAGLSSSTATSPAVIERRRRVPTARHAFADRRRTRSIGSVRGSTRRSSARSQCRRSRAGTRRRIGHFAR